MRTLNNIIELHDSVVSGVEVESGSLSVCFSGAYLFSKGKGWVQPARLIVENARLCEQPGSYPLRISDGGVDMINVKYYDLLQLPFKKIGTCTIRLLFDNAEKLVIIGRNPELQLIGGRKFVETIE